MNNKILLIGILVVLSTITSVSAWNKYEGIINPYPIGVYTEINGIDILGIEIEVCNLRTSFCTTSETNKKGYAQFELANFLIPSTGNDQFLPPYLPNDDIKVKTCEGNDACEQIIKVLSPKDEGYKGMETLHFKISPSKEFVEVIVEKEGETVIEDDNVIVKKQGEDVEVLELNFMQENYGWFLGFLGLIAFFSIIGQTSRAKKMWKSFLDRHRKGKYKKK